MLILYTVYSSIHFLFLLSFSSLVVSIYTSKLKRCLSLSGKSKLADASAEPDAPEPETQTTAESNPTSDEQSSPESQDLPSEKSEGEQDLSAMEVE